MKTSFATTTNTIITIALLLFLSTCSVVVTEAKSKFLVIGCRTPYNESPTKCGEGGGVFTAFDDLTKAKILLEANAHAYASRMIVEYKDCKLLDPKTIDGIPQTAANGFSKWWVNWYDVARMMRPAQAWVKQNPMDCKIMEPPTKADANASRSDKWASLRPRTFVQHQTM